MIHKFLNPKKFRYERKFLVEELGKKEALFVIKENPAMFSEIFHERRINNIYFDSSNMESYHDNVMGNSQRVKIRIRWYNDLFGHIKKPVLEIKIRNNELGSKQSYQLKPFILGNNTSKDWLIKEVICKSSLPRWLVEHIKSLKFALLNSYTRRYFRSADKKYRITIDYDLKFNEIFQNNNKFVKTINHKEYIILELKYERDADEGAENITNSFPFRLTKSSKFVSGIDSISEA